MRYIFEGRTADERRREMKKEKRRRERDTKPLTPQEAKGLLSHYCGMKPPYHFTTQDRSDLKRLQQARDLGTISRRQFKGIAHLVQA